MSGGAATTEVARELSDRQRLTVVTNSLSIASELAVRPTWPCSCWLSSLHVLRAMVSRWQNCRTGRTLGPRRPGDQGRRTTWAEASSHWLGKVSLNWRKGLGGGFRLARDPQHITLFDVVEPLEHVAGWSGCVSAAPRVFGRRPIAIHNRWKAVRDAYLHVLRRTTIGELVAKGEPGSIAL